MRRVGGETADMDIGRVQPVEHAVQRQTQRFQTGVGADQGQAFLGIPEAVGLRRLDHIFHWLERALHQDIASDPRQKQ